MIDALKITPELLAMREALDYAEAEKKEAFADRFANTVAQVRYDIALERFVAVTISYRDMIRKHITS